MDIFRYLSEFLLKIKHHEYVLIQHELRLIYVTKYNRMTDECKPI